MYTLNLKKESNLEENCLMGTRVKAQFSDNALRVLEKRYLRKDDRGEIIETP